MTPAAVLVHVVAADSSVGLPLSHELVHLQSRRTGNKRDSMSKDTGAEKSFQSVRWVDQTECAGTAHAHRNEEQ